MQAQYDGKTGTLSIALSINGKSTQESSTGKTFILGSDRVKFECEGREATVAVNVYVPVKPGRKGK